jgi:adenylate cyclase
MSSLDTSHLTAAFVDLCAFSAYTQRHGDQAARDLLVLMQRVIRHHAQQSDLRIAAWTGDGCLVLGSERAGVTMAVRRCVAELEAVLPLRARAGVATGPVLTFGDGDVVGATVNLAARRCAAASPGEVLTTFERRHVIPTVREVRRDQVVA